MLKLTGITRDQIIRKNILKDFPEETLKSITILLESKK